MGGAARQKGGDGGGDPGLICPVPGRCPGRGPAARGCGPAAPPRGGRDGGARGPGRAVRLRGVSGRRRDRWDRFRRLLPARRRHGPSRAYGAGAGRGLGRGGGGGGGFRGGRGAGGGPDRRGRPKRGRGRGGVRGDRGDPALRVRLPARVRRG
ncbi:Translation initiation factor 2 [[Actinomadura] parvosata subsp. kistnae]|nr:Translation initiation factor 2 [Actinomadura parvosata subsp. kistnae]